MYFVEFNKFGFVFLDDDLKYIDVLVVDEDDAFLEGSLIVVEAFGSISDGIDCPHNVWVCEFSWFVDAHILIRFNLYLKSPIIFIINLHQNHN